MTSPILSTLVFNKLPGNWILQRAVSGFGKMNGRAVFTTLKQNLLKYREEGVQESGVTFFREYFYQHQDQAIVIYFDEQFSRPFQNLTFKDLQVQSEHLCGCDVYKGIYDFREIAFGKFTITYEVEGPNKKYVTYTQYTKEPEEL